MSASYHYSQQEVHVPIAHEKSSKYQEKFSLMHRCGEENYERVEPVAVPSSCFIFALLATARTSR